ncbi:phosphatidylserine decarboxylase [Actinomadura terrae]|uniref:phosphatidylserine decarboxylase n=1 Tax=Actinomadura terrae TaxID=604353 RepID=UPI001FA6B1E4|nr:phosphatidylserine decarboxylase [Actinomadura terrae]
MTMLVETRPETIEEFISKIREWHESDHDGFRTKYEAAIADVMPPPSWPSDGPYYDWRNAGIDELCAFFEDWYNTEPTVKTSLDYIEKFSWINYENYAGMEFVTTGPGLEMTADFTYLQGKQMDDPKSKSLISKWIKDIGTKRMEDYEIEDWETFNEFFLKKVKPGKRKIDGENDLSVVVAPTDCIINMIVDNLTAETRIPVKSVAMNVRQLLNGSELADRFVGGTAVSCILMPDTYHWYHAPVGGKVVDSDDSVGGIYYGMWDFPELLNNNNVGYNYDYGMFDRFRRGYAIFETPYLDKDGKQEKKPGYVGLVAVGLNSIASVEFDEAYQKITYGETDPVPIKKGGRVGHIKYGGSLNILLFEKGRFPAIQLQQGQRIGVLEHIERTEALFNRPRHMRALGHMPFATQY